MFKIGYFVFLVLNFIIHVHSFMRSSVAPRAPGTRGGCPMRQLSKFLPSLLNPFPPVKAAVSNTRTVKGSVENLCPDRVESREALPWSSSISGSCDLTYMPILQMQLNVIREMGMEEVEVNEKFVYKTSSYRPARIGNMCFKSNDFRCVRLTYFDGGDAVQVFNSVWYPSYDYDIPIFGTDLISLGKNRVLNVIDFQPLFPTDEYSEKYINHLSSIRSKYSELQGTLSGKIYDDTSFFSKNMLFGRFPDTSRIKSVVQPAFTEYLQSYLSLLQSAVPDTSADSRRRVFERQCEYDTYSALKDPAVGLFDAYFGKTWSNEFLHNYLFQLSKRSDSSIAPAHSFVVSASGEILSSTRAHQFA